MKCNRCGATWDDSCVYCGRCGAELPRFSFSKKFFISFLKGCLFIFIYFILQSVLFGIFFLPCVVIAASRMSPDAYYKDYYIELTRNAYEIAAPYTNIVLILIAVITLTVFFVIFKAKGKNLLKEIRLSSLSPASAAVIALLGISLQFAFSTVLEFICMLLPFGEKLIDNQNSSYDIISGGRLIFQILNVVLFSPVLEETAFRGLAYMRMKKGMPKKAAVLIVSVIFGALHGTVLSFVYATVLGIFLIMIYEKYNSILAPVICHIAFNGASFISLYLPDSNALETGIGIFSTGAALILGIFIFKNERIENHETKVIS